MKVEKLQDTQSLLGVNSNDYEMPTKINRIQRFLDILKNAWKEHVFVLLFFGVLSVALSWPLVLDFGTKLIGDGHDDTRHSVWIIWNVKEALLGRQSLFHASNLYYPAGTSLLLDGVGMMSGIFSLPFAPFGPVAAYNGTVLVGLTFSGYFMYLLARSLKFDVGISLFAAIVLVVAPAHFTGVYGHIEKVFVGFFPLLLITLQRALNLNYSRWWTVATAFVMLFLGLYSGYQFAMATFAGLFFFIAALILGKRQRWRVLGRGILVGAISLIVVGPLLLSIVLVSRNGSTQSNVAVNTSARIFTPDVTQFFFPSFHNALFAPLFYDIPNFGYRIGKARFVDFLERSPTWYGTHIETAVTLSFTALALCIIALLSRIKGVRIWLIFATTCTIFALGPSLRIFGETQFTAHKLPVILPFSVFNSLPGFEFFRASGRWMMLAPVGFGVAAAFGLTRLVQRWPKRANLIIVSAIILLLAESWPRPWIQAPLPEVPKFYQEIASDRENYAVLDLPAAFGPMEIPGGWPRFASIYMAYQMTHKKPIAWGYLSHTNTRHPVPFLDRLSYEKAVETPIQPYFHILHNGKSAISYRQATLAAANYRYVVYHKRLLQADGAKPIREHQFARDFLKDVFGENTKPYYEDEKITVYKVFADADKQNPQLELQQGNNWRPTDIIYQWATSPATLEVFSPKAQEAFLEITPVHIHDPKSGHGFGANGQLNVQVGDDYKTSASIIINQVTRIPLRLEQGKQTITLSLQAGNFQPSKLGISNDSSYLSFAIRTINLVTTP
jgi:hypothetical protein